MCFGYAGVIDLRNLLAAGPKAIPSFQAQQQLKDMSLCLVFIRVFSSLFSLFSVLSL
jgi:hypothetical protein